MNRRGDAETVLGLLYPW